MNKRYPVTDLIAELPASVPFVGPEAAERAMGRKFAARIGANESAFGPSPAAIAAMEKAASEIWMYADPENHDLRAAIAAHHGVAMENVVVGEGIDGLLGYTCRLFVEPGRHVVTTVGAYPTFNFHVAASGGALHFVPMNEDREDPQRLLDEAERRDAVLIFFSNPNNPMGTCWPADQVREFAQAVPENRVLVLDEAYIDFAPPGTELGIDPARPNVLRYRTFSKAYGMAGARVGYCIGEAGLIAQMEKVRNHFGMNRAAQEGALAALGDRDHLRDVYAKVASARDRLDAIAEGAGLSAVASATNFVAIDCGRDASFARQVVAALAEEGVFVRMPIAEPQARCIRVTAAPDALLDRFEEALRKVLARLR